MDYTECLLNCAGENLFTNCSWYLKKRRTPIYTQVPSKQHCRLSICSYFGCVWQILRIWDEQACLVPSPNQSSMCVTSRRQLGTGGWKRQWRSRIAMERFAQHRKHRRRWPAPGSQVFAKPQLFVWTDLLKECIGGALLPGPQEGGSDGHKLWWLSSCSYARWQVVGIKVKLADYEIFSQIIMVFKSWKVDQAHFEMIWQGPWKTPPLRGSHFPNIWLEIPW